MAEKNWFLSRDPGHGPARRCDASVVLQHGGNHHLWYSDRKRFALGKILNSWLE